MENELLKSVIQEIVTDDMVERIIREVVRDRIDYHIDQMFREEIARKTREYTDGFLNRKLEEIYSGQVRTDNGFGLREQYESFEDYVKGYIQKEINSSYQLESKVRGMVNDKLNKYCKQVLEERNNDLADKVLEHVAEDYGKPQFEF